MCTEVCVHMWCEGSVCVQLCVCAYVHGGVGALCVRMYVCMCVWCACVCMCSVGALCVCVSVCMCVHAPRGSTAWGQKVRNFFLQPNLSIRTSLVAQWQRLCLSMQETQV